MQEEKNVKKKGMKAELKKVIWPTKKQTVKSTSVTITFVLIISLVLIFLNVVFSGLNKLWINAITPGGNDIIINSQVSGEISGDNIMTDISSVEVSGEVISGEVLSGE